MIVEPACRDAMQHFDSVPPAERAATLARRCREAYCPRLPEPRPALCGKDFENSPPSMLLPQWKAFCATVLSFDLGPLAESAGALLAEALGPNVVVRVEAPPPAQEQPALTLTARPSRRHVVVELSLPGGITRSLRMARRPGPADITALAAAVRGLPISTRAVLQLDRSLTYGTVVSFMDALRSAGIQHIAFAVEQGPL
jgi:biopolymer transport protein ExbD